MGRNWPLIRDEPVEVEDFVIMFGVMWTLAQINKEIQKITTYITLFRSTTIFYGNDNIL